MIGLTLRLRRWLAAPALVAGLLAAARGRVAADFELPPVDEVFVLSAQATARDRIEVRWKIADGYYLYRHRTSVQGRRRLRRAARCRCPTARSTTTNSSATSKPTARSWWAVVTGAPAATATGVALTVKYQGCADAGVCYPPQTRTLTVALPQRRGGRRLPAGPQGRRRRCSALATAAPRRTPCRCPPRRRSAATLIALDGNTLLLRLHPGAGLLPVPRQAVGYRLEGASGLSVQLPAAAKLPAATPYRDEHFGDVAVYFDQVDIALPVARTTTRRRRRHPGAWPPGLPGRRHLLSADDPRGWRCRCRRGHWRPSPTTSCPAAATLPHHCLRRRTAPDDAAPPAADDSRHCRSRHGHDGNCGRGSRRRRQSANPRAKPRRSAGPRACWRRCCWRWAAA